MRRLAGKSHSAQALGLTFSSLCCRLNTFQASHPPLCLQAGQQQPPAAAAHQLACHGAPGGHSGAVCGAELLALVAQR